MSNYLQKIIYLTQTDYNTLANGGTVTHGSITLTGLESDYIYLTDGGITDEDMGSYVVAVANGGTGLSTLGTSGQVLKVNSAGTGLEWGSSGGAGTVTSVQVQATSPVQSSTSTAQTSTLNTTISLASAYGDTQNPYGSKTKNYVLAAPSSAAGSPSFRALVADDIPSLTKSKISDFPSTMTPSSHTHGNIQNGGTLQTNDVAIASGDKLVITDSSDSNKVARASASFDGSTTTKALTQKGTFETFYQKPSGGIPGTDLADSYYLASNPSGYTTNTGTVTSVRVQATSPVNSSTSTAQSSTLNTTISLADGYGDTKNPYASKTANYILASPNGSNGAPTFRALVAADLPTVPTTKGGTGLTSIGTAGQVLKVNSGATALEWGEAASSVSSTSSKMVTTTVPNVTSVGSAPTLGTAIDADDITAWNAGSTPTLGTAIDADDITAWSAGAAPTLGTAIDADDITAWSAGSATTAAVADGVLTITAGTAPSLSYTARSIPNVTSVGSAPSLSYTARSIPNVTSVGSVPSLTYTARSIPNITNVGSAPTLGTAITVATGSLDDNASGATVVTSVSSS